ncbi:S41 family peptidase [Polaribacter sp. HL-MS24]|uniref:S41 family peptidase n=1 Tax=Polaribacter sp. HL-MS24 TaxID=3077735 RepID=UPI002934D2B5|nr:S41 family peptidase [Polaribacter sp. HL-MS24]WOC40101.1 S41 family peptidase [Polaribacter sp. HL-MS24]
MKLKLSLKIVIALVSIVLLSHCSSKTENIPENIEVNHFVWKGLNAYYLWQNSKPDLADKRFNSQRALNNYLSGFPTPELLFENLLFRPTDRFSMIFNDYVALENAFQGITLNNGMEFGLVRYRTSSSNVFGYVRYVVPGSDASINGVTRGMIFNQIDGKQITDTNYGTLLSSNSYSIGLAEYNDGDPIATENSIQLTKSQLEENPVKIATVLDEGVDNKIGYLMYNQFSSSFDDELNAAFLTFKNDNISDLIVDLRYNGGGSVRTATYLGAMITGGFNGEIFSKQVWNEKVMAEFPEEDFLNRFTDKIDNGVVSENINSLNLSRVYFIVSGSTASASELVINSLRSYIDVFLVGTETVGKQVGSITLYDSDNLQKNGLNFNTQHNYALQPIVLEIANKDDQNEINGFVPGTTLPGVVLSEDYGNLGVLGERSDPLLDRTIRYMLTGERGTETSSRGLHSEEIYNSKLASPTSNNMYVELH